MSNLFGFNDETGVLSNDPSQPFFGLGLLKLEHTAPLYQELDHLKSKVVSKLQRLQKPFEFKFNEIHPTNFSFYRDLVNLYFSYPTAIFSAFVVNKKYPNFKIDPYFHNTWDAYIGFSKLLIENNIKENEQICILADYLGKPKSSPKYFETEIRELKSVFNTCMMESHASIFIQVVDVLIGCVVLDFRTQLDPQFKPNKYKWDLVEIVRKKLKVKTLAGSFSRIKPNNFSVWPFKRA